MTMGMILMRSLPEIEPTSEATGAYPPTPEVVAHVSGYGVDASDGRYGIRRRRLVEGPARSEVWYSMVLRRD